MHFLSAHDMAFIFLLDKGLPGLHNLHHWQTAGSFCFQFKCAHLVSGCDGVSA